MGKKEMLAFLHRVPFYGLGYVLFYEPFMFFSRVLGNFIPETGFNSLHVPCARIPLYELFQGRLLEGSLISLFFLMLLGVSSAILGPIFCGWLCPAGAFGEFLSRLLPDKYKIDWAKYVPVQPLRYGFFAGFLASSFLGFGVPCMYCNYYSLELFVLYMHGGVLLNSAISLLVTFFLAFVVLGLFTKGGRGYCNFFCPVGAYCSAWHMAGKGLPGALSMKVDEDKCVGCGLCAKACPMRAIKVENKKAHISCGHCIVCQSCGQICPKGAISYSNERKEGADHE